MTDAEFDRTAYLRVHDDARDMRARGARLITIAGRDVGDGTFELIYAYDLEGKVVDHRFTVLPDWEVDTITDVYSGAMNMERENIDLLGLRFKGMQPGLLLVPGSKVAPLRKPPPAEEPKGGDQDG
jgi:ech hydrogenase subunit D